VLGLVGVFVYLQVTTVDKPALVEAQPMLDQLRHEGGLYYLPLEVTNRGGKAGEEVIVRLSVTHPDGAEHLADLKIGFLAAGQVAEAIVALARDPRGARVEVTTIGYLEPG
jgi:uncharacterized protein (TIGR02588 family)